MYYEKDAFEKLKQLIAHGAVLGYSIFQLPFEYTVMQVTIN